MKILQLLLLSVLVLLLSACSDKPSESYIKKQLTQVVEKEYQNLLTLDSIEVHEVVEAGDNYVAKVSFDIVLNASKKDIEKATKNSSDMAAMAIAMGLSLSESEHKFKKGYVIDKAKNERLTLVKEKGDWIINM
ncbi:hypothetical protein [Rheinheimera sp.]|uniref:hypothetical protein n=1 Tax=Rheinheimera sp. TaxID=1869214 RepID=UPI004047A7EF